MMVMRVVVIVMVIVIENLTQSAKGATSEPCCMKAPKVNQKAFKKVNWFSYLDSKS